MREDASIIRENDTNEQKKTTLDAWNHSDYLCQNYVLNELDNNNMYCTSKIAEELWDSLEKKVQHIRCRYKRIHSQQVLRVQNGRSQDGHGTVQELQLILHDIHTKGI